MKHHLPKIAILVVIVTCFIVDFDFKNWTKTEGVIANDIRSYYGYLPAKFIYDDIKIEKDDYTYGENQFWFWQVKTTGGKYIFKMTCGLAILYYPFFYVANVMAELFDFPQSGFSEPYKFFLLLSSIFYLCIGLIFTVKNLEHFKFSQLNIALTVLLIGLGTNLFCYSTQQAPMSHVYSFALFSIFIYLTICWHEKPKLLYFIGICLVLGMISLIRITNSLVFIFFILYGVKNFKEILKKNITYVELFILFSAVALIWWPQIRYWKITTENYLVFAYNEEGFFFLNPHIYKGLFNFRKGWLIYTPMMFFALFGIYHLKKELSVLKFPIVVFLLVNVYVIFSWWSWWYGGSFGQRPMIESYAILAIPLAAFIQFVSGRKFVYKAAFGTIVVFFIWLNIFQTYQYQIGSLHQEAMNQTIYFKQFGKLEKIKDFENYLSYPNIDKAMKGK